MLREAIERPAAEASTSMPPRARAVFLIAARRWRSSSWVRRRAVDREPLPRRGGSVPCPAGRGCTSINMSDLVGWGSATPPGALASLAGGTSPTAYVATPTLGAKCITLGPSASPPPEDRGIGQG